MVITISGVSCIDMSTLTLSEGEVSTEGKLMVNGMPVCRGTSNMGWGAAQVYKRQYSMKIKR